MSRIHALLGAFILTVVVAFSAVMISPFAMAQTGSELPPTTAPPTAAFVAAQSSADYEAALASREATLQEQLASRQAALVALDETYRVQFAAFESDLEQMADQLSAAGERVVVFETQAERLGAEVAAADLAFQEEMTGLQNSLVYEDGQLRGQIESVYAQLEGAYAQIAAQETQVASDGQGDSSSSVGASYDDHDDDDHDDDDHDDDHDDDDHDDDDHDEHDD
jgi:hypothetical protein